MTRDEKLIEKAILDACARIGVLTWKVSNGRRGYIELGVIAPGRKERFPDTLLCVRGRMVALEVKAPGKENHGDKKRLAEQAACRESIRAHGGVAEVVTSVEEALAIVERVRSEAA